jgi:hypothetical protein
MICSPVASHEPAKDYTLNMPTQARAPIAPHELEISKVDAGATMYVLQPAYTALHGIPRDELPPFALLYLEPEAIAVVDAERADEVKTAFARRGPVYTPEGGASLAVPTGRVFLRRMEGFGSEALRDAIERAGFAIEAIPDYAPHTAWLAPVAGDVGAALFALPALQALEHVESAEPQMLSRRALRHGSQR